MSAQHKPLITKADSTKPFIIAGVILLILQILYRIITEMVML